MTAVVPTKPRASVVWFHDLHRWSVGSFIKTDWRWPADTILPLSAALTRKAVDLDRTVTATDKVRLVTLHFDGEMELRDESAGTNFKGRLFIADPGDVIYSKIDVRNGAIGIIPDKLGRVCVSSEYPVYSVNSETADARYIKLMFRTDVFRREINSMITGASGRKRVQPSDLESVKVPLPPLPVQRKIVTVSEAARKFAAESASEVKALEDKIELDLLEALGLRAPQQVTPPKTFAIQFSELERWGIDFNQQLATRVDPATGKYDVAELGEVVADLENGWSPKCLDRPAQNDEWGVLKMGAVSFGTFDETQNKAIPPKMARRPELEVKPGDFLISRANITRLVGACALVKRTRPGLMLCDKIFRAVWRDPSPVEPQYLDEVLKLPHLRQQIEGAVTGTSATMKNITKPSLLALRLPLPPLKEQQAMMKQLEAGRQEITKLKVKSQALTDSTKAEIEAMILGTKSVE